MTVLVPELPDIQEKKPDHQIKLNRVGVSKLKIPVFIKRKNGTVQQTVSEVSCYVDLDADKKGINMSRLPISIYNYANEFLCGKTVLEIAEKIREISSAKKCDLIYEFPYFTEKEAPITKQVGIVDHKITFNASIDEYKENWSFSVEGVGTSLCPCSKEISNEGAHNQKCYVEVSVYPKIIPEYKWIWIEEIIEVIDKSVSCEIYSVLKRSDEKYVTEKAYKNAKFVEDIARQVYELLKSDSRIDKFKIKVSSDESIHIHRAEAIIESDE